MARDAGASKVFFASAAPPVRFPNVYGIDIPTRSELIANGREEEEIARLIHADWVAYQDLDDLKQAVQEINVSMKGCTFEASVFDGKYVTGDIGEEYFATQALRKTGSAANVMNRGSTVAFLTAATTMGSSLATGCYVPAQAISKPSVYSRSDSMHQHQDPGHCDSLFNDKQMDHGSSTPVDNLHQTLHNMHT